VHSLKVVLTDACLTTKEYPFSVKVTNTAPYWNPPKVFTPIEVPMNTVIYFNVPLTDLKDDEGHSIMMAAWVVKAGVRTALPVPYFISQSAAL